MLVHSFLSFAALLFRVSVKEACPEDIHLFIYDLNLYILNDVAIVRVYVKGFGCSTSLADAEVLAGCLSEAGHAMVSCLREADLVVYVTCAVKTPTENRMISLLKRVPGEKKLVVAGCLPLINPRRLLRETRFDGLVGPAVGEKIVEVVRQVAEGGRVVDLGDVAKDVPGLGLPSIRINPRVSIVPVSYGCLGSCAYCCVRFARGRLRSHGVQEIVDRVERDVSEGVREFWLTSQDMACYGRDLGSSLPELIERVCKVKGEFFVRVGMMTPNGVYGILEETVEAFESDKVFRFLHLPVQSGDAEVLGRMDRQYKVEDFLAVVKRFRMAFQRLSFATDVIVGFPGETEREFSHTLGLVEEVRPDVTNVSKFFPRPGTPASEMSGRVPSSEVKARSARLASLARRISSECNRGWVGWSGKVLVDEAGKGESVVGRNFAYKPVVIQDGGQGLLGEFVDVKVVGAFQSYLLGEVS